MRANTEKFSGRSKRISRLQIAVSTRSAFAVLVARLEDRLGIDPFSAAEEAVFPVTLGDFVKVYEHGRR